MINTQREVERVFRVLLYRQNVNLKDAKRVLSAVLVSSNNDVKDAKLVVRVEISLEM